MMLTVIEHSVLREVSGKGYLWRSGDIEQIVRSGVMPVYDLDHSNMDMDMLTLHTLQQMQGRGWTVKTLDQQWGLSWWWATDLGKEIYATSFPSRFPNTVRNRLRYWAAWMVTSYSRRTHSFLEWCWERQATWMRQNYAAPSKWRAVRSG